LIIDLKKKQILVIGYAHDHCTSSAYDMANEIGREIAKHGAVVITGGLRGVMEAASKGAKEEGGTTVSIIPQEDSSMANRYSDIVIPTGIGFARDFITAYSADAVIIVGGGVGTMIEACVAYLKTKPIIALKGSGGIADQIAGTYLDDRKLIIVLGEDNPKNAVEMALSEIASR
jgi:uncharacterized protein (TIGR00725 family)